MSGAGAIVDTNLFLLLVVGQTDERLIPRHKRLSAFDIEDFRLLKARLQGFRRLVLLPHVLAEVSNLIAHIGEPARSRIFERFREIVLSLEEATLSSAAGARRTEFVRLGLTDAVLLALAAGGAERGRPTLLTTDLALYLAAGRAGVDAINFNHERGL